MSRKRIVPLLLAALAVVGGSVLAVSAAFAGGAQHRQHHLLFGFRPHTRTPIRHLVVILQENISFDHYFGTYPNAANTDGQTFVARPGTPAIDGLPPATSSSLPPRLRHSDNLLTTNPNTALPQRFDSSMLLTCDENHAYSDEQQAFNGDKLDHFVQSLGTGSGSSATGLPCNANQVMDYYDGNTVTAMWNYAQHYAMSDWLFGSTFGPSSPGNIGVVADTGGVDTAREVNTPSVATSTAPDGELTPDGKGAASMIGDPQPYWDDCSTRDAVGLTGHNIGDVMNSAGVSWGWFQGGLSPVTSYADTLAATGHSGQATSTFIPNEFKTYFANSANRPPHSSNQAQCSSVHPVGGGIFGTGQWGYKDDYIPHHEPFQYYPSTANPHHLTIPADASGNDTVAGLATIGHDTQTYVNGVPQFDTPNHQYDISDFDQLVSAIHRGELPPSALPAVSFVKAPGYQDGHPGYSDPADEQQFVVREINALMRTPDWAHTAVIVGWDDSDGWYDHANPGVLNPSLSPADNLTNTSFTVSTMGTSGQCGPKPQTTPPLEGEQGRCGFGPRLPFLVVSPFTRENHVDHNLADLTSVSNLIEYNWRLPAIAGSTDQLLSEIDLSERIPFDLAGLFKFQGERNHRLFLDPITGQPARGRARDKSRPRSSIRPSASRPAPGVAARAVAASATG
jgi:phospholipase C